MACLQKLQNPILFGCKDRLSCKSGTIFKTQCKFETERKNASPMFQCRQIMNDCFEADQKKRPDLVDVYKMLEEMIPKSPKLVKTSSEPAPVWRSGSFSSDIVPRKKLKLGSNVFVLFLTLDCNPLQNCRTVQSQVSISDRHVFRKKG